MHSSIKKNFWVRLYYQRTNYWKTKLWLSYSKHIEKSKVMPQVMIMNTNDYASIASRAAGKNKENSLTKTLRSKKGWDANWRSQSPGCRANRLALSLMNVDTSFVTSSEPGIKRWNPRKKNLRWLTLCLLGSG